MRFCGPRAARSRLFWVLMQNFLQLLALLLGHGALPDERGQAGQARSKSVFYRIASCFGDLFLL